MSSNEWPVEETEEKIDPKEIEEIVNEMLSQEDVGNAIMQLIYLEEDLNGKTKAEIVRKELIKTEEGRNLLSAMSERKEADKRYHQENDEKSN